MQTKIEKPYVLRVAEFIYFEIIDIKNKNPETNNIQAFEILWQLKNMNWFSSGEFHDKWFQELEKNNFVDKLTGKKITDETIKLLEVQKDSMIKLFNENS